MGENALDKEIRHGSHKKKKVKTLEEWTVVEDDGERENGDEEIEIGRAHV